MGVGLQLVQRPGERKGRAPDLVLNEIGLLGGDRNLVDEITYVSLHVHDLARASTSIGMFD